MASLLPIATTLLATIISFEPLHIPSYSAYTPVFTLIAVYHWTVYRPDLLPASVLFVIGLAQDLLSGDLPGVTALLLLLARAIVLPRRRYLVDRSVLVVWAGFALLTGAAMLFLWGLHSLLSGELLEARSIIVCGLLTVVIFPIASFLLGRTQQILIGEG